MTDGEREDQGASEFADIVGDGFRVLHGYRHAGNQYGSECQSASGPPSACPRRCAKHPQARMGAATAMAAVRRASSGSCSGRFLMEAARMGG
jgi:hypothetical protein